MAAAEVGPGTQLGKYRLTEPIGQGGMGVVWKGENVETGEVAAVKLLVGELAEEDGFRERFKRESQYAGSLDHPHVIRVFEAGEQEGALYMAMQFVDGTDLKALLAQRGKLEAAEAARLLSEVAEALDAAHGKGILHRDVKPGNIMIESATNRCYLTDFGLSKNPSEDSFALTAAGSFVGTIDYTAPEQILAKPFDHRVDVYSLACVLYEALSGEVPYPKSREVEVLYGHIQDPPPRLREKRPDAPEALEEVIVKAMAKDPDERYQTCGDLMQAARLAAGVTEGEGFTAPAAAGELVLRVVSGKAAGDELHVDGELLIGRHAEVEAGKLGKDPELSRRHAMLRREGPGLVIEDLGSTNGTFVNGARIGSVTTLRGGDRIEVGDTVIEVAVVTGATPEPEQPAAAPGATVFAPIVPSSTPPAAPAAEAAAPLPPVAEEETPAPPEAGLPEPPGPETEETSAAKAPGGKVSLRVEIDLESGELRVGVEDGPGVRVSKDGDGAWRIEPEG